MRTLERVRLFPGGMSRAALAIAVVALSVRLWGIGFGLPDLYGPAEGYLVANALALGAGDFAPVHYIYPPFASYLLFIAYGTLYAIGRFLGLFHGVRDFALSYLLDPTVVYLVGRGFEALVGAATAVVVMHLGRILFSPSIGVLAGLAMALLPLHVEYSHYVRPDVPMVFFVVLSLLAIARFLDSGRSRDLALAGFSVGLGTATKYSALLWGATVALAWAAWMWRERVSIWSRAGGTRCIAALGGVLVGLVVGFPHLLIAFDAVVRDFSYVTFGSVQLPQDQSVPHGLARFAGFLLNPSMFGPTLSLAALLGVGVCVARPTTVRWVIVAGTLVYLVAMARSAAKFWYLLPAGPALAVLAAAGVAEMGRWLRRLTWLAGSGATIVTAVVVFAPTAWSAVRSDIAFVTPDTRTSAREWIETNIAAGTRIAVDNYGPALRATPSSLRDRWKASSRSVFEETVAADTVLASTRLLYRQLMLEVAARTGRPAYDVLHVLYPYWKASEADVTSRYADRARNTLVTPLEPEYFETEGYEYFVTSSHMYARFFGPEMRRRFPKTAAFYETIEGRWQLAATFTTPKGPSRAPDVKVYRITPPEARDTLERMAGDAP